MFLPTLKMWHIDNWTFETFVVSQAIRMIQTWSLGLFFFLNGNKQDFGSCAATFCALRGVLLVMLFDQRLEIDKRWSDGGAERQTILRQCKLHAAVHVIPCALLGFRWLLSLRRVWNSFRDVFNIQQRPIFCLQLNQCRCATAIQMIWYSFLSIFLHR